MPSKSVLFLHPPDSHPVHWRYGQLVSSKSLQVDPGKIMGVIKGLLLPYYDCYLCESVECIFPTIARSILSKSIVIMYTAEPFFTLMNEKNSLFKSLFRQVLRNVDGIIAVSELMEKEIKKFFSGPVRIVPPFISEKLFQELSLTNPNLESHNIISIARYHPDKGVDLLVEAFKKVKEEVSDANLHLIGRGLSSRNTKIPIEWKEIEGLHMEGFVKDLGKYLRNSSVFVQSSRFDAFPVATLEALCSGLPAVVTERVGAKSVIKDLDNNLIRRVNSEDIAEGIIQYFTWEIKRKRKISKKAKDISKRFKESDCIEKFKIQFYNLVVMR